MLYLKSFTFNPFQENTYLVYNDEKEAFIIDPGNYTASENEEVRAFVAEKELRLSRLLLTHGHIDHILGNKFILDTYGLLPEMHKDDLFLIERMPQTAAMYGIVHADPSPLPEKLLSGGDVVLLGDYEFECIFVPGHSPGSLAFYNKANKLLIGGDVLFRGSIGRSDLPGGDHDTLVRSVREKIFSLGDDIRVYSGHGPVTLTGVEKATNPFLT